MTFNLPLLRTALIGVLLTAGSAMGHEGHDHGDAAKTSPAAALPRLEAASGPFELVAVLHRGELLLYLDGFATNAPIVDATIAVETPAGSVAAETRGGTYLISASWATPGSHDLVFTVSTGDQAEILTGTLVVPPDAATPGNGGHWTILSPFQILATGGNARPRWHRARGSRCLPRWSDRPNHPAQIDRQSAWTVFASAARYSRRRERPRPRPRR